MALPEQLVEWRNRDGEWRGTGSLGSEWRNRDGEWRGTGALGSEWRNRSGEWRADWLPVANPAPICAARRGMAAYAPLGDVNCHRRRSAAPVRMRI
jgi:hypothetical protein